MEPGGAATPADYERLRAAVLTAGPHGWRLGHGVLAGKGMAAWMAAWAALSLPSTADTPAHDALSASLTPSISTPAVPAALSCLPLSGEIVAVLAAMALAHA